jgi:hypothetical protein
MQHYSNKGVNKGVVCGGRFQNFCKTILVYTISALVSLFSMATEVLGNTYTAT